MAKNGLVFYFVMSIGFDIVAYLFYLNWKYTPKEFLNKHPEDVLKSFENRDVFLSPAQIKMLPERSIHSKVPEFDIDIDLSAKNSNIKGGYM